MLVSLLHLLIDVVLLTLVKGWYYCTRYDQYINCLLHTKIYESVSFVLNKLRCLRIQLLMIHQAIIHTLLALYDLKCVDAPLNKNQYNNKTFTLCISNKDHHKMLCVMWFYTIILCVVLFLFLNIIFTCSCYLVHIFHCFCEVLIVYHNHVY